MNTEQTATGAAIPTQRTGDRFPVVNPPALKQAKVDDRVPNLADAKKSRIRTLFLELNEAAKGNPALGDDLAWLVKVADLLRRKTTDPQLRADLNAVLLSGPPLGTLGDRVAEAILAYTQRLLDEVER